MICMIYASEAIRDIMESRGKDPHFDDSLILYFKRKELDGCYLTDDDYDILQYMYSVYVGEEEIIRCT